jgi:hypothetical protein
MKSLLKSKTLTFHLKIISNRKEKVRDRKYLVEWKDEKKKI